MNASHGSNVFYLLKQNVKEDHLLILTSGQRWGASESILLHFYMSLVRPILDFEDITFDGASTENLKILDLIQSQALRICTGVLRFTNVYALQIELHLHVVEKTWT